MIQNILVLILEFAFVAAIVAGTICAIWKAICAVIRLFKEIKE